MSDCLEPDCECGETHRPGEFCLGCRHLLLSDDDEADKERLTEMMRGKGNGGPDGV